MVTNRELGYRLEHEVISTFEPVTSALRSDFVFFESFSPSSLFTTLATAGELIMPVQYEYSIPMPDGSTYHYSSSINNAIYAGVVYSPNSSGYGDRYILHAVYLKSTIEEVEREIQRWAGFGYNMDIVKVTKEEGS